MFGYLMLLAACVVLCQIFDYRLEKRVIARKLIISIIISLVAAFIILVIKTYGTAAFLNIPSEVPVVFYIISVFVDVLAPMGLLFVASIIITKIYQKGDKISIWVFVGMAACLVIAIILECIDMYYTQIAIMKFAYSSFYDTLLVRSWPRFNYFIYTLTLIPTILLIVSTITHRCKKLAL